MKKIKNILLKNNGQGIFTIIINDPKTYNSLSFKTLTLLLNTFKKLDNDKNTKVIIIEHTEAGKKYESITKSSKNARLNTSTKK